MAGRVNRYDGESNLEWNAKTPDLFKKYPIDRWLSADEVVKAVQWVSSRWHPTSQAFQDITYILNHYEGDFDGSPSTL